MPKQHDVEAHFSSAHNTHLLQKSNTFSKKQHTPINGSSVCKLLLINYNA